MTKNARRFTAIANKAAGSAMVRITLVLLAFFGVYLQLMTAYGATLGMSIEDALVHHLLENFFGEPFEHSRRVGHYRAMILPVAFIFMPALAAITMALNLIHISIRECGAALVFATANLLLAYLVGVGSIWFVGPVTILVAASADTWILTRRRSGNARGTVFH